MYVADDFQQTFGNRATHLDLALGSVYGIRWWRLTTLHYSRTQPPDHQLYGMMRPWRDRVQTAECIAAPVTYARGGWIPYGYTFGGASYIIERDIQPTPPHRAPEPHCGCGFYAYWDTAAEHRTTPTFAKDGVPICGVIEGWGRTLIGDRGFRCQKARIVALAYPGNTWWWRTNRAGHSTGRRRAKEAATQYGVPLYGRIATMLKHHPLTTDYLP